MSYINKIKEAAASRRTSLRYYHRNKKFLNLQRIYNVRSEVIAELKQKLEKTKSDKKKTEYTDRIGVLVLRQLETLNKIKKTENGKKYLEKTGYSVINGIPNKIYAKNETLHAGQGGKVAISSVPRERNTNKKS